MNPTLLLALARELGAAYVSLLGSAASAFGGGSSALPLPEDVGVGVTADWGLSRHLRLAQRAVLASGDLALIQSLLIKSGSQFTTGGAANSVFAGIVLGFVVSLSGRCRVPGVASVNGLDSFARYYNAGLGGPWHCLLSPDFAAAYATLFPSSALSAVNIAPPAGQVLLATRATGGLAVTYPGIDQSRYAGQSNVQAMFSSDAAFSAGSRTITVYAAERKPDGSTAAGAAWAGAPVGSALFASLVPADVNSLILSVADIALPATMTAGSVSIYAISS